MKRSMNLGVFVPSLALLVSTPALGQVETGDVCSDPILKDG